VTVASSPSPSPSSSSFDEPLLENKRLAISELECVIGENINDAGRGFGDIATRPSKRWAMIGRRSKPRTYSTANA
jgi:hypothetical protein